MSIIAPHSNRSAGLSAAFLLGAAALAQGAASAAPDETAAAYQKVVHEVGSALVSVKYVLKVSASGQMADRLAQSGDGEQDMELTALVIESGGLILCSNSELVGRYGMAQRYQPELGLSVTPTDMKILIGDDTEGVDAKVIARDVDLDLAWIRIDNPGDRKFEFVDLSKSAEAKVGEKLLTVSRLGKFFDRALVVSEGRVAGMTTKPRDLIIPSGIEYHTGMPVFADDGSLVGISVIQFPAPEDMEAVKNQDKQFEGADRMMLPAAEVVKATERAKEMAASGKSPDDAPPAVPDTKDAGDTGDIKPAPAGGTPTPPKK